jgi:integrase
LVSERKADEVTNATINRDLTAISQVIACGEAWGACNGNPALAFNRRLLTKEVRLARPIPTDGTIKHVASRCPRMFASLVVAARLTGARQEELASLSWSEVDAERREMAFLKTKTHRPRTIKLSSEAAAFFQNLPRHTKSEAVFWHDYGQRYENVSSRFLALRKQAFESMEQEQPDFTFHDLRHAYAVNSCVTGATSTIWPTTSDIVQ